MPSITKTKTGGIIHFDAKDFLSCLSPQYITSLGAPGNYFSNQLMLASAFNPYRVLGYAAPGLQATDLANVSVVTAFLRNICLANESSSDYGYAIGANNLLHRVDISAKAISNTGSWPHMITTGVTGIAEGLDCVTYSSNVGGTAPANKIVNVFYGWNDTGGTWEIGKFNTVAGTFIDNFMFTVPANPSSFSPSGNTKPHPMCKGPDDIDYIGDGNRLHSYDGSDGADGTFNSDELILPAGYVITTMSRLPDYLAIFAYYSPTGPTVTPNFLTSGPAMCFLWNYLDRDFTYAIPLNDNVVTESFEIAGTVGCFTQGAKPIQEGENRFCTLQILNGLNFEIQCLFVGNAPVHGGAEVVDNSIQWNSDGALHCFGTPLLGTPAGLNKLAVGSGVSGSFPSSTGLLRTIGGLTGFQMMSSGATTSGGAQYLKNGTFSSSALVQTATVSPDFPLTGYGHVIRVSVRFAQNVSGGRALNAYLTKENGGTMQFISGLTTVDDSNVNTYYDKTSQNTYFGSFQDLGLILQWQGVSLKAPRP